MYYIATAFVFGFMFVIWSKSNVYNFITKAAFFGMCVWGVLKSYEYLGL